jgi:hypothetical protein
MRLNILVIFSLIITFDGLSQNVPLEATHYNIYEFLDEMANNKLIIINSAIKPYSRSYIFSSLQIISEKRQSLNDRQTKELDFFLHIYSFDKEHINNPYKGNTRLDIFKKSINLSTSISPIGIFYKDSSVTVSLKPIWGIRYMVNDKGDNLRYTWGGAEAYMTVGNHWGFYASLREHNMTKAMAMPSYFVQEEGGNYKIYDAGINAVTYSEMRGGITYTWKWGSLGLVKDHLQWGVNYNGANIFSGRTPSFPMINLDLYPIKWFDFHYYHGWLVSEVIDSSRSYITSNGDYRAVYRNKFIAANLYTFKLWKYLHFSFGNSIIYSDVNVQPAYLIPFLFYKSVDHTLNHSIDNQNSQMFFILSSHNIKYLHLYGNIFIDDFSVKRIFNEERQNFVGRKFGLRLSDLPLKNIIITGEYTRTNPIVYKHRVETLSFETNKYNLGHYLRDNSQEIFVKLNIRPIRRLDFSVSYLNAAHGNEYQYTDGNEAELCPFMKDITWKNEQFSANVQYEFLSEIYLLIDFYHSKTQGFEVDGKTSQYYLDLYTPSYLQGLRNTVTLGFNVGF